MLIPMYKRELNLDKILKRKSVFLFGPRQTGKSTLLKSRYPLALFINLLRSREFQKYSANPGALREVVEYHLAEKKEPLVVIDEVQKIPALLDEVHDLIETHKSLRFILTGSSARKLKHGAANLLGGRASWVNLHPLVYPEVGGEKWFSILSVGGLPSILDSREPWDDLADYVGLYLKEEVKAEGLSRSINNFSRFLETAALTTAEQINFSNIANDAQLPPSTVRDYYEILNDTLLGTTLPAFTETKKRKAMTTAKFYLFDCGVFNAILKRREITPVTVEYGKVLEQAIFLELKAYLDYHQLDKKLEFWRSTSNFEVDFLVYETLKDIVAIEVKGGKNPGRKDYKGLLALAEEFKLKKKIIVCHTETPRITEEGIEILPILTFLEQLWAGKII